MLHMHNLLIKKTSDLTLGQLIVKNQMTKTSKYDNNFRE